MTLPKIVLMIYALVLFAGAFMGLKAGSKISLISGLISGALVLLGIYLIGVQAKTGYLFLVILNGLLTIVFLMRFLKTHHWMPAGMLLLLCFAVTVFCLVRFFQS